jgi:hypothetical protein
MRLIREVTEEIPQPVVPEDGWNVGHLAHHGILLTCDGFSMKLDIDQLNILFDLAEDGASGEVRDHDDNAVYVEVSDSGIILSRDGDKSYPQGIMLDLKTLKEMGIEQHDGPEDNPDTDAEGDTIDPDAEVMAPGNEIKEGVKRAYRRTGNKLKRGFRVTSGFRKGRVVASAKSASKPRAKASTRMKLRLAGRRKKIIRILKGKRTRMRSASKRLVAANQRIK